jgi:HlyD family secretion protein
MKRAIIVLLIVAAIGAGAGAYYIRRNGNDVQVNTAPITRGEIIDTVGATGTLQAVTTVQVGSQVSGNIQWLGADFNSIVHKGQVIARIDPSLFQAQVEQSRANLVRAQADYQKANADVEHNKVQLTDAEQKYTRAKELAARSLLPQSDLDAAKIAVDSAQAQLQSSQAAAQSSKAAVNQAQASLNQNQVNLEHCTITTPIDGIVTARNVDVGQTVAASFQSPTLFVIAADLTKMQVNANVDEADVGRIRPGQNVTFKVDAYPTEDFQGIVTQIRLQPIVVQNVTTYGTVIDVPNQDLKLKPGMTANVKIEIAKRSDALRVPNAALRFRPNADMFAAIGQAVPPEIANAGRRGQGGVGNRGRGAPAAGGMGSSRQGATGGPAGAPGAAGPAGANTPPSTASGAPAAGATPGASADERRAQMLERFKTMSPEERQQAIQRMKERGIDVSAFEAAASADKNKAAQKTPKNATNRGAETIDALFAPLPNVESTGRAWLFVNKQLKPVRLRLGITDGTNTEILDSNEVQPGTDVVTGVIMSGARTTTAGAGNPLMGPQRGMGGPPRGR